MTDQEKAQKLYLEACEKLDDIQNAIHQLVNLGQCLDQSPIQLVKYCTSLVEEYDSLSPEEQDNVTALGEAVMNGSITPEEALEMVPEGIRSLSEEDEYLVRPKSVSNSKKPLLN